MSLENLVIIICLVGLVIAYGGYRYFTENVKLRYQKGVKR